MTVKFFSAIVAEICVESWSRKGCVWIKCKVWGKFQDLNFSLITVYFQLQFYFTYRQRLYEPLPKQTQGGAHASFTLFFLIQVSGTDLPSTVGGCKAPVWIVPCTKGIVLSIKSATLIEVTFICSLSWHKI